MCAPFSATGKPGEVGGEGALSKAAAALKTEEKNEGPSSPGPSDLGACLAPR